MADPVIEVTDVPHVRVYSTWWVVESSIPHDPEDVARVPTTVSIHRLGSVGNEIVCEQSELSALRKTIKKFEVAMGLVPPGGPE